MKYSPERREAILRKLLPPNNRTVAEVAQEEGISDATLYNWRNEATKAGQLLPDHGSDPEGWSSRDKFNAVLETAALSESELGEYCRKRGLYIRNRSADGVRAVKPPMNVMSGWRSALVMRSSRRRSAPDSLNANSNAKTPRWQKPRPC